MTVDHDFVIAAWLDEGPTELPEDARRTIAASVRSVPQQRPGTDRPWRPDQMPKIARLAIAASALVIAGVAVTWVIRPAGSPPGVDGPNLSPSTSVAATPSPRVGVTPVPQGPPPTWPAGTLPLGTITLTDTECYTMGFRDQIGPGSGQSQFSGGNSIKLANTSSGRATFGWYRLNEGRTWDEAARWVIAANAAIADGTSVPAPNFVAEQRRWEVDAGTHDYLVLPIGATPGTYGMLCTAGDPPPADPKAIYLVGPLEVE